jgi:Flp pilus assembly protein TadD
LSHERVLERELGLDLPELDSGFDQWLREEYSGAFAAAEAAIEVREVDAESRGDLEWLTDRAMEEPLDVATRIALGRVLLEDGRPDEAERWLVEARDLFPRNPDPRGPNRMLAAIYAEQENPVAEMGALEAHLANYADDYEANMRLAELREEAGDPAGAADAMQNALLVYPFEIPVHERLAAIYEQLGGGPEEVRERRVILDLAPVDRAGAYYELAAAQLRAGETDGARASVLSALELAPRFPEAQDLLIEIMQGAQ